jgi:hypothetical protein
MAVFLPCRGRSEEYVKRVFFLKGRLQTMKRLSRSEHRSRQQNVLRLSLEYVCVADNVKVRAAAFRGGTGLRSQREVARPCDSIANAKHFSLANRKQFHRTLAQRKPAPKGLSQEFGEQCYRARYVCPVWTHDMQS